jgi:hypothetical protein
MLKSRKQDNKNWERLACCTAREMKLERGNHTQVGTCDNANKVLALIVGVAFKGGDDFVDLDSKGCGSMVSAWSVAPKNTSTVPYIKRGHLRVVLSAHTLFRRN